MFNTVILYTILPLITSLSTKFLIGIMGPIFPLLSGAHLRDYSRAEFPESAFANRLSCVLNIRGHFAAYDISNTCSNSVSKDQ